MPDTRETLRLLRGIQELDQDRYQVQDELRRLPRERDRRGQKLEEVGRIFKVTRERVRQIEAKAVRKLQHPVRSRMLEGFLESALPS